jgi:hypothetical protein
VARIRSIKPEFWRDEKIATLENKLAGYFFIGLWNVADDEGKFQFSPKSLSLQMPIFRSKEVVTYLSELTQKGLIRESADSQWGLVVNWNHQKIDKPKVPAVKVQDIQWLDIGTSTIVREKSPTPRRKDRIGSRIKDRIGSDRGSAKEASTKLPIPSSQKKPRKPSASPPDESTLPVVQIYCDAWNARYKSYPPISGKVAGQIKQLVKDLGASRASELIQTYLDMTDQWFLTKRHDITTLVTNLNSVAQYADTGEQITRKDAQQADSATSMSNQLRRIEEGKV